MSFPFEQALRRKCDENPDLSVLDAQWAYDRRLVADALQVVGRTFPHYSRHDVSHSNTILAQLARILGQGRIDRLSATDLWLLLEAAHHHDIGMVVTDAQATEWLTSAKLREHLARLQHGEDRELTRAARLVKEGLDAKGKPPTWALDVRRALTPRAAHPGPVTALHSAARAKTPSRSGSEAPGCYVGPVAAFFIGE